MYVLQTVNPKLKTFEGKSFSFFVVLFYIIGSIIFLVNWAS